MFIHGSASLFPIKTNQTTIKIEDAANRAKAKDAYANPSSTIHLLTDKIIKYLR